MAITVFMGVSITLDSFERDELPGVWWPQATLIQSPGNKELEDVAHHQHFGTKAEADHMALRIAKRRVKDKLHQG